MISKKHTTLDLAGEDLPEHVEQTTTFEGKPSLLLRRSSEMVTYIAPETLLDDLLYLSFLSISTIIYLSSYICSDLRRPGVFIIFLMLFIPPSLFPSLIMADVFGSYSFLPYIFFMSPLPVCAMYMTCTSRTPA
jgi:hypothetical protein